jgi:tRNA 2-thiouridine synthesizing protein A
MERMDRHDLEVDARGLLCPLPVLRLAKALRGKPSGTVALLRATDPAAVADVRAYCDETGSHLLGIREEGLVYCFVVRKDLEGTSVRVPSG